MSSQPMPRVVMHGICRVREERKCDESWICRETEEEPEDRFGNLLLHSGRTRALAIMPMLSSPTMPQDCGETGRPKSKWKTLKV